ncbi:Sec-independent protein translocase subunit TatB, partial [Bordetella petrii]|nr:Sec-independent protein translocase subunit TatB [Bordetella petrii]
MFDVSFTELMVIGVIALVVIGPERLPKVARTVGHLLGRAQRYVNDVKSDIQREIELDELRKFKSEMDDAASSVQNSLRDTETSLRSGLNDTAREATQAVSGASATEPAPAAAAPAAPAPAAVAADPATVPP